ncbi:hypothetical protein GLOIN_2v205580 [Rhizophagus irregularis DAOM 181602=DAOM 197198]|uniref:Uncharacterized protein n=1 Tax=Rhizophagus irregularis (strain DAOM 181602 / DAOM 197198 / MUCL 43194) TaxID=747089 RepID=A0A2P4PTX7_RHIID|nr:hypothetical protein GLOIN_2v205580 [Rhizophagus irregularis DAOM 181602=DAOM 197198]POG68837.1 hypothetical protein GLOIN_2v205580 [Rhizophagus irregularis DAOM 181602=DAOM 197198]GET66953.1 hypothetical protein GLOIN_2v205580 [Rhizophagus irregularis DAOM 181602=DAOM 197198]|eukprot:XP_025175703.1 hypothetical protein GLOIN_2v205580 [Rhizophagus irregularis DAOM 181602=DAOM 197198]
MIFRDEYIPFTKIIFYYRRLYIYNILKILIFYYFQIYFVSFTRNSLFIFFLARVFFSLYSTPCERHVDISFLIRKIHNLDLQNSIRIFED